MMKSLPLISTVYSMVIQEERQSDIHLPHSVNPDVIVISVTTESTSYNNKKYVV